MRHHTPLLIQDFIKAHIRKITNFRTRYTYTAPPPTKSPTIVRHTSPNIRSKVTSHLFIQQNSYEACPTLGTRKNAQRTAHGGSSSWSVKPSPPCLPASKTQVRTQLPGWAPAPSRPDSRSPPASSYSTPSSQASASRPDTGPRSSDSISARPPRLR